MFSPVYKISNKTLLNLIEVEVANKIVNLAQLQTDWEERLRTEAIVRNIFGQSKFTGANIGFEDLSKIVKDEPGRDDKPGDVALRTNVVAKEREIQQVLNFLNTQRLIEQMAYLAGKFHETFGDKDLSKINSLLGERLVPSEDVGRFRAENQTELSSTEVPMAVEIPFQMEDVLGWFSGVTRADVHPINQAGIIFYELLRISPYSENNLLTAFNFYQLVLFANDYGFKKMLSFSEEILLNREAFQQAFSSVEKNGGDMTNWLEFLSRRLSEGAEKIKTKVVNLMGGAPIFKSETGKVISLSERQIAIMEEITVRNEMTIKEIRGILPLVSDDTILRDVKDLISKKLIRKKGKTKGAVYVLGKVRSFK